MIANLPLPPQVAANDAAVFGHIAEAESAVHGAPIDQIHFHEVGTLDAVADVVAASYLFHRIGATRVVASPVNVGSGTVRCAHGVLPVPAPATALILRGVPTYAGAVKSELCTPTGAALLAHFASTFEAQPLMAVERIGYGIGTKEFAQANCVRALLGEEAGAGGTASGDEEIVELSCNIDDDTPEHIAFALELLLDEGALDAFTVPLTMKKSRPGVLLCAICKPEDRDRLARLILRHTSTLGVRWKACGRLALARAADTAPTPWGPVQVKRSSGYGVTPRAVVEHDSAAALARAHGLPLKDIEAFPSAAPGDDARMRVAHGLSRESAATSAASGRARGMTAPPSAAALNSGSRPHEKEGPQHDVAAPPLSSMRTSECSFTPRPLSRQLPCRPRRRPCAADRRRTRALDEMVGDFGQMVAFHVVELAAHRAIMQ